MLSRDVLYFHVLFKSREIRTLRSSMAIVFPFPVMDVVALASGLNRHLGWKSPKRADRKSQKMITGLNFFFFVK